LADQVAAGVAKGFDEPDDLVTDLSALRLEIGARITTEHGTPNLQPERRAVIGILRLAFGLTELAGVS